MRHYRELGASERDVGIMRHREVSTAVKVQIKVRERNLISIQKFKSLKKPMQGEWGRRERKVVKRHLHVETQRSGMCV